METPASVIDTLINKVEAYSKTTYELAKLKLLESTTGILTALMAHFIVFSVIALFSLVLSIGIALLLGELLGKPYYGFFILAGFYLIVGVVFHFFIKRWIRTPVSNIIIKQVLK